MRTDARIYNSTYDDDISPNLKEFIGQPLKSFSLFRALNPASKNSGVCYPNFTSEEGAIGKEVIDSTVPERISYLKTRNKLSLMDIFEVIVGSHYSFGYYYGQSKGILDFLIFPLISRKIIHDIEADENTNIMLKIVGYSIAIPLEIVRFLSGAILTLLASPLLLLTNSVHTDSSLEKEDSHPASLAP